MDQTTITNTQAAYFELMRNVHFSTISGPAIVDDLLQHRTLWQYVKPTRADDGEYYTIAEMQQEYVYYNTVYILATTPDMSHYRTLQERWKARNMDVIHDHGDVIIKYIF